MWREGEGGEAAFNPLIFTPKYRHEGSVSSGSHFLFTPLLIFNPLVFFQKCLLASWQIEVSYLPHDPNKAVPFST